MVVGGSLKNCSKGSPRMAGKSTRGKKKKKKKEKMKPETRPRIRAAGDRMVRCWASGHTFLFHISCCPQMSFRTIALSGGDLADELGREPKVSHHTGDSFSFSWGH